MTTTAEKTDRPGKPGSSDDTDTAADLTGLTGSGRTPSDTPGRGVSAAGRS
ncbi:hypothetical protein HGO75_00380 [Mycobacterium tuberculosis]|nr:hypothetical protein [Mycobacterium tuberculosis]